MADKPQAMQADPNAKAFPRCNTKKQDSHAGNPKMQNRSKRTSVPKAPLIPNTTKQDSHCISRPKMQADPNAQAFPRYEQDHQNPITPALLRYKKDLNAQAYKAEGKTNSHDTGRPKMQTDPIAQALPRYEAKPKTHDPCKKTVAMHTGFPRRKLKHEVPSAPAVTGYEQIRKRKRPQDTSKQKLLASLLFQAR